MGCDIHMDVELFDGTHWVHVPGPKQKCWLCGGAGAVVDAIEVAHTCSVCNGTKVSSSDVYTGRNYDLFAKLAGVRNFNRGVVPLAPPRGLPVDCSEVVRSRATSLDWHSHSWFTFAELSQHDWTEIDEEWVSQTMPALAKVGAPDFNPNHVRVVFWFDN